MTARTSQSARTFPALTAPTGWISRARNAWAQYRSYTNTLAELQALTDRELADIGLSRLQVRDIARYAIYGK